MQKRILTLISFLLSVGTIPAFADMGTEGVILWIVIYSGIFIACGIGMTKAIFWASAKSKNNQEHTKSPYKITYFVLMVLGGVTIALIFYHFILFLNVTR